MNNPESRSQVEPVEKVERSPAVSRAVRWILSVSLRTKLVIGFLIVALVPLALLTLLNTQSAERTVAASAGANMKVLADSQASAIGGLLDQQISRLQLLSQNQALRSAVQAANATYTQDLTTTMIGIGGLDVQWRQADAAKNDADPLVQSRLNNEWADLLRGYRDILPDNIEVFITDRYGALVAVSNRPSDYNQADEVWWQKAWKNGQGAIYIGQLEYDFNTKTYASDLAVPIYAADPKTAIGVLHTMLRLTTLIDTLQLVRVGQTGRAELYLPDNLRLVEKGAEPVQADRDIVDQLKASQTWAYIETNCDQVRCLMSQAQVASSNPGTADAIAQLGWTVVVHQNRTESLAGTRALARTALLLSLIIAGAVAGVALLGAQLLTTPIRQLTEAAQQVAAGNLTVRAHLETRDEIGTLASAFNAMIGQLRQTLAGLEQRVAERTAELSQASESLSHRVNQLQASAEVSHAASTLTDPEQLVPRAVELIQQRFEFYYVGLFLADADNRNAVLQYGTGTGSAREAGRVMREHGHRLGIGGESMVGWACANQQARIALDVGQDAVRFVNPLLPDTRSEMALPLLVGERVIGALDVQSAHMSAFDESDITVLQGMADQVAIALENARLLQQTQAALKEIEAANRLLVREGWQGYLEQKTIHRAEFVAAADQVQNPRPVKAAPQAEPLTIPLELRGQSLGRLTLRRESNRAWSEDETQLIQTIAVQTMLAAENARLIEETQRSLGETRALYESSREITSAGEMSEVLAAVLNNLAHTGIHAAAVALFDAPRREEAKNIELAGSWDHTGTPRLATGVRFEIANFPLFDRITSEKALVSQDLLSDPEVDDTAKLVLGGLGLRSMAVTPLMARGQWMGVLFALMETVHTFTTSELSFQRALADQAAVAIDSRRLLAETQRRAEREQLIRQITTRIRAAGDIQGVLETTANELARSMGVSRSIVRLTTGDNA